MLTDKRSLGNIGEKIAVNFLKKKGYKILDRNFRTSRFGEIDIIAQDKESRQIVFVEVKTKSSDDFGSPEDEFTVFKKQKMRRAIQDWFWHQKKEIDGWRIDLVAVDYSQDEKNPEIRHYSGLS